MGGVATMVASHLRPHTVRVAEGRQGDEYIITRLDHVEPAVNVVNIYGDQEKGDLEQGSQEKVLEDWKRLLEDLGEIERRREHVLVIGDMNRAVGAGEWGVPGNKPRLSWWPAGEGPSGHPEVRPAQLPAPGAGGAVDLG